MSGVRGRGPHASSFPAAHTLINIVYLRASLRAIDRERFRNLIALSTRKQTMFQEDLFNVWRNKDEVACSVFSHLHS